jgi:hypothetical protein
VASAELCDAGFQIATVPEVPVAENNDAFPRKDDIWASRQFSNMETITKATTPQLAA